MHTLAYHYGSDIQWFAPKYQAYFFLLKQYGYQDLSE